jgi:serine O-acetyltransferase
MNANSSGNAVHFVENYYHRQLWFQRIWRIGHWCETHHVPAIGGIIRILCRILFAADIPVRVQIARGVVFMHNGLGVVVHTNVRFEGPALVFHNVTLGNSKGLRDGEPTIGSHVLIGAGACVLGPVRIGNNCVIGANAVVTADVPDGSLAIGNPMTIRPVNLEMVRKLFGGSLAT